MAQSDLENAPILSDVIAFLEDRLARYKRIFIFDPESRKGREFEYAFCTSEIFLNAGEALLVLGVNRQLANEIQQYEWLAEKDLRTIIRLYYTYEFSYRIRFIYTGCQYPGILNYVENGLLSTASAIDALLRS